MVPRELINGGDVLSWRRSQTCLRRALPDAWALDLQTPAFEWTRRGYASVLRSEKFVNLSGNTGNAFEKPDGRDRITNHPTKEGGAMAKTARKSRAKAKTTRTRKAGKRGSATKRKTAPARRKTATRRGKSLPVKKVTRGRVSATKGKRAAPKRTAGRRAMAETPTAAPVATADKPMPETPATGLAATADKQIAETQAAAPAASSAPNPVTTEAPVEAQ